MKAAEDHPRVCGEKVCGIWLKCASLGSPPRMRGKGAGKDNGSKRSGITPAYAGKSPWALRRPGGRRGSPPRMRGKGCV